MRHFSHILLLLLLPLACFCQTIVDIDNTLSWIKSDLTPYIGQSIQFRCPWYLCNNYNGYSVSPRRIMAATNQEQPGTAAYQSILSLNSQGTVNLSGISGYHRLGERMHNLCVKVNSSSSLTLQSCDWRGNSRAELEQGYNHQAVHMFGEPNLIVCAANLHYYLVENLGTGYGPDNYSQHEAQRQKVAKALALINADIYGLMEIEQGQAAQSEIAQDLTQHTGRQYTWINDGSSSSGSYTKSGYVYCSETVEPVGDYTFSNEGVIRRKYMQAFRHKQTGEVFIYSINHFKAKVGAGQGDDADQGDGQGGYNGTRTREARAVLNLYHTSKDYFGDEDILIMGDLNAYGKEDPIRVLTAGGMTDLHRYCHADSSYSYVYHGEAGYLDHALVNTTMLPQVTGMVAYHINSDEDDTYNYYGYRNDGSIFRSSDHDPIIVGLRLGKKSQIAEPTVNNYDVLISRSDLLIRNAEGGHARLYDNEGRLMHDQHISNAAYTIPTGHMRAGLYILHIYYAGLMTSHKILIR